MEIQIHYDVYTMFSWCSMYDGRYSTILLSVTVGLMPKDLLVIRSQKEYLENKKLRFNIIDPRVRTYFQISKCGFRRPTLDAE
jgi:hypothetical protein